MLIGMTCMIVKRARTCGVGISPELLPERIQPIDEYCQVQSVFDSCNERTVVTFDVDNTLITANDVFARNFEFPLWFKICLIAKYCTVLWNTQAREKTIDDFLGILFQQAHRFVFDKDIVRMIKQLHWQKCIVVGLTAMGSGSAGVIQNLPEWRATMLKDFDIDLSGDFNDVSFKTFPVSHNNYPCLYKGILCANYAEKGAVLGAFLDYYHVKPERVISFDDRYSDLTSIDNECAQRGIPFAGYQMLGTKKLPGEWNTDRSLLQFDYALEHKRWLSDNEADAILAGEIIPTHQGGTYEQS